MAGTMQRSREAHFAADIVNIAAHKIFRSQCIGHRFNCAWIIQVSLVVSDLVEHHGRIDAPQLACTIEFHAEQIDHALAQVGEAVAAVQRKRQNHDAVLVNCRFWSYPIIVAETPTYRRHNCQEYKQ